MATVIAGRSGGCSKHPARSPSSVGGKAVPAPGGTSVHGNAVLATDAQASSEQAGELFLQGAWTTSIPLFLE